MDESTYYENKRLELAKGLRALADVIDEHPEVQWHQEVRLDFFDSGPMDGSEREAGHAWQRALAERIGGDWTEVDSTGGLASWHILRQQLSENVQLDLNVSLPEPAEDDDLAVEDASYGPSDPLGQRDVDAAELARLNEGTGFATPDVHPEDETVPKLDEQREAVVYSADTCECGHARHAHGGYMRRGACAATECSCDGFRYSRVEQPEVGQ